MIFRKRISRRFSWRRRQRAVRRWREGPVWSRDPWPFPEEGPFWFLRNLTCALGLSEWLSAEVPGTAGPDSLLTLQVLP